MIKRFFLALAAAACIASCNVNDDFDLSDVNTDDVEIGDANTEFSLPVANFIITISDNGTIGQLSSDGTPNIVISRASINGYGNNIADNINDIMKTAELWLPSVSTIDIKKLTSSDASISRAESDYVVDLLVNELKRSQQKRDLLAEGIKEDDGSLGVDFSDIYNALGVNKSASQSEISSAINSTLNAPNFNDTELKNAFYNIMVQFIKDNALQQVQEVIQSIDISDIMDVVNGELSLIASVTDDGTLPFEFEITSLALKNRYTGDVYDLTNESISIYDLQKILRNAELQASINITKYKTAANSKVKYLKIKLGVKMTGSVKL